MNKYYSYLRKREEDMLKKLEDFAREKKRQLTRVVDKLAGEYESIKKVIVFGSLVNSGFNQDSDIDLYIENIPVAEYYNVRRRLEEALEMDVDLHTRPDNETFLKKIKERGVVLYER